jgi:hypothetical protein
MKIVFDFDRDTDFDPDNLPNIAFFPEGPPTEEALSSIFAI